MALGLLGVVIFSLTLPFTRIVVQELHPLLNGLGRALFAAIPAAALLLWRREKWPTWQQVKGLSLVIAGVILGFPVLSAWAMQTLPASHGALVNGLQPLCVALYAAWLSHERPSKAFWACAALGSALVLGYALISGAGSIQAGDLLMLGAIAVGGLGYAEGGPTGQGDGRLAGDLLGAGAVDAAADRPRGVPGVAASGCSIGENLVGLWLRLAVFAVHRLLCLVRRAGHGRHCPGQSDPVAADLLHHCLLGTVLR